MVTEKASGSAKRWEDLSEAQPAHESVVAAEEGAAREGLTAPEVLALILTACLALVALVPVLLVLAII
jgi:hypothetical protein